MPNTKTEVENVNHPGVIRTVDAGMYAAMRKACLEIVPKGPRGLTLDAIRERLPARLPQDLFPGGARVGWWAKTVQLDLEAKRLIARDRSRPIRLRKV